MNDLGIMNYYLGLQVLQKPGDIYLDQGKYVINIIRKFGMMENKPMMTAMVTNLKKLRCLESNPVDPTCYRKLLGSLMYMVNTRPNIWI